MENRKLKESELAIYKNRKEAFNRAPDNIKTSLEKKAKQHNEDVKNAKTKKTDKYILAVVFWRGVGAYKQNPESVRPSVVSPEQWGLGRVNGFLYALKNGKFKVKPFDQDLLPKGHPHSSRSLNRSISRFNDDIKLAPIETVWGWEAGAKERTLGNNDWDTFKKAHAWHNPNNLESLSGYRLPFAQVIDNELQVVFRGVASAMGALLRNIKGQDPKQSLEGINKSEYRKIYDLLSKYYEKFGKKAPDYIGEDMDIRDLGVYKKYDELDETLKYILLSPVPESMDFPYRELDYPSDEKTEAELKLLMDLAKYRNDFKEYIVLADEDHVELFYKFLKENDLPITEKILDHVERVINDSSNLILKIKYKYNRPRPYQVAERLGLDFVAMNSKTANTPSYPSGHTIQSMMLADCLGMYYPEYKPYFYEISDKISMSRMFGGYHFPSDVRYGKMIFSDYMKYKKENERVLDSSIGSLFDDKSVSEKLKFDDLIVSLDDLIFEDRSKEEVTNFPKSGDNLKVSLRNSNWQIFPVDFAEKIKKEYPSIWAKGGNIKGNDQYRDLVPVQERGGNVTNKREEDAVRLREAWVARHFKDFRIAGVIAQIKWLAVGSRGLQYMKDLVREEMKKVDEKKDRSFYSSDFEFLSENEDGILLKSKEPLKLSMYVDHLQQRNVKIENKEDAYVIKGIASSTSVDHYGTEMSLDALRSMKEQIKKGVVILPRHETLSGGTGLAEWDEVIGRTLSSEIIRAEVKDSQDIGQGYILEVTSELYDEDKRSKNLMKRLSRGELIGQSIGGWFERVRVIESIDDSPDRIIVEDVTLDHIAITRAPANPDSYGLSLLNVRTKLNSFFGRNKMEKDKMLEERELDHSSVVVEPEMVEKEKDYGDGHVDVQEENPMSKVERMTPLEMDLEDQVEDMKEEIEDMEDDYDSLKSAYDEIKSKYEEMMMDERMKEKMRMKEEMERMKHEMEEMEKVKDSDEEMMKEEMAKMPKEEMAEHPDEEMERMKDYMKKLAEKDLSKDELMKMKEEIERMMLKLSKPDKLDNEIILENLENKIDTRSKLDHDLNNNNSDKGEDMNKEQMQELAEMIARSVAGAVKPVETVVETVPVVTDNSVEELRSELARTQQMLAQVMKNPVRRGRHVTTTITGVGAKGAFSELISRSRSAGSIALASVVEHNIDKLGNDNIAQMSSHELRSMLSAGLNAAQRDGLLGQALASWE
jgi:phage head maturation protease